MAAAKHPSFPRKRESTAMGAPASSSFPRKRESSPRKRQSSATGADTASSFPRLLPSSSGESSAADAAPRYDWLLALLIIAAIFAIYALTAPRTVTFEDDGLFIMASLDAGVAHPPGYPLYTLLGYLFSHLPFGTPAFRIHLLSGLLGALACAALFFTARRTGVPRAFALAAALAYGVSEHFWSQAIIAEVYTLNALLIFAVLLCCLHVNRSPALNPNALYCAALCFGLGLANHWPLMILAAPAFAAILWHRRQAILPRLPALALAALGTAGAFYLWMVWRSWQPGIIAFYGPLDDWQSFWYYISRSGYGGVDASPSAGWLDKAGFAWYFLKETFFLYTPIGAALALLGIRRLWQGQTEGKRGRAGRKPPPESSIAKASKGFGQGGAGGLRNSRALLAATAWIYFAHSLLLILQLGFDYEYLNVAVFRPYPLVAYGILAFWMAHGMAWLAGITKGFMGRKLAPVALPILALLIPALTLHKNHPINNRSQDRFAERYGRMILDGLAPDAALFVVGDTTTAPLGYLHYAEGARPDVELINTQGLVYPTRLFIPPTTQRIREAAFAGYMRDNAHGARRPVYTINRNADIPNPNGAIHFGYYQKIDPDGEPAAITLLFDQRVSAYFESLAREPLPQDRWNRHQHGILLQQYGNFLGYTILSDDPELKRVAAAKVEVMKNQYYGLVDMAEVLIEHGFKREHLSIAQDLLAQAEPLADGTLSKDMRGRHHYRRGFLAYRLRDYGEARKQFIESVRVHDHPDNPSRAALDIFQAPKGGNG